MIPLPHQIVGAAFLAARRHALLADSPRVGKTGATIMALDDVMAPKVLVVTTASGRPVWRRAFRDWPAYDLYTRVCYGAPSSRDLAADRLVVSWDCATRYADAFRAFRTLVLDESHYAKSWEAKRTQAVYGNCVGLLLKGGLAERMDRVWCLSGTPIPNAPNDLHPMLRAIAPERLAASGAAPDAITYDDFLRRYCIVRPKRISRWTTLQIVVGGRHEDELRARLSGFWLRRTQADIGIREPIFEVLPLHISAAERREVEAAYPEDAEAILDAAETLETRSLDMHLGPLRRVTGAIKARGVAQVVHDEFAGGLDKIVLMAWHVEVLDYLAGALSKYGVARVDGATPPEKRAAAQAAFARADGPRVFLGQIVAAGEAIDLSAAADLIFVESSWIPKDMSQAALRITNVTQARQPRVRVAALEGSVDEALQTILTRKVATIREVMPA